MTLRAIIFLYFSVSAVAFTKDGTTYTTDGSQSDVNAAIADADPGDTVNIGSGSFTWGASGLGTVIDKAITLAGAGEASTTVTAHTDANGVLFVSAGVIKSFTFVQSNGDRLIHCGGGDGWRFTDLTITGAASGRIFDIEASYGLIDHCNIHMPSEQIFMYGKVGVWNSAAALGTSNAVYIEDCAFTGDGYTDSNADGQMVMRFNTIAGTMKFDAHGVWSNSPARSSRFIEVYHNHWTSVSEGAWWPSVHVRGGTGIVFSNTVDDNTFQGRGILWLDEYGAILTGGFWDDVYQTPFQVPIEGQIGIGTDNTTLGAEPLYMWGNTKGGTIAGLIGSDIPGAAITQYRTETGNGSATFTMIGGDDETAVIVSDRDYFSEDATFDGTTGVGIGTAAQMAAITPTTANVGFWVTDEGTWNASNPGADGRLYRWDGDSWNLYYTPYAYPHPLNVSEGGGGSGIVTATNAIFGTLTTQ